jgi:hypothetical protein
MKTHNKAVVITPGEPTYNHESKILSQTQMLAIKVQGRQRFVISRVKGVLPDTLADITNPLNPVKSIEAQQAADVVRRRAEGHGKFNQRQLVLW